MATIAFKWDGRGIARLTAAAEKLEGPRKLAALRRAVNHTGDKTFTVVRRVLAKEMGLTQSDLARRGLTKKRANDASLTYQIIGRGGHIPLKDFAARQGARGVSAAPWGVRRMFKSTFIVASIGGNVFKRIGKKRLPIEKLWGPAIPREMVREVTATAFQTTVAANLPGRVEHEVRVLADGVLS